MDMPASSRRPMRPVPRLLVLPLALSFALLAAACGDPAHPGSDAGFDDWVPTDGGHQPNRPDAGEPGEPDGGDLPDAGPRFDVEILSATPPRGQLSGGTVVALSGYGFVDGFAESGGLAASEQTSISFGGNPALDLTVIDDDTIEVRSPPGVRGLADIVLTNPNGTAVCEGCFTYFEAVEVFRVTPAQGATDGGDAITITGKGFVTGVLVLVGGSEATDVSVAADGLSLTARTPPGVAGSADVGVVGASSSSFLSRSFVYVQPMRVEAVEPAALPLSGGSSVTVRGEAFSADAVVSFGGVQAETTFVSATELQARVPAGAAAGAVDVRVQARRGAATLSDGFTYFDPDQRALRLWGVSPTRGPATGGTCAQGAATCLRLTGSGFDAGAPQVLVGGASATARLVDDHTIEVDLPAGAPGVVDVQVRNARGGALLEDAFAWVAPLSLSAVSPGEAPASGQPGTTATLSGVGLSADCRVRIGAKEATVVGANGGGTQLTVQVPAGSSGARDVVVSCGQPGSPLFREARLDGAFRFRSPLKLLQVTPDTGAIAGNMQVTLYGSGFDSGLVAWFGEKRSAAVEVRSPHVAVVRTPRAERAGSVDVRVEQGGVSDVLRAAFGYVDPTNVLGGGSGGPMLGTLNVTVLNNTPGMGGPVEGATVAINGNQLFGLTDSRGQVTFSDPSLLKPVTITAYKQKHATSTIARIDARNVTLFMQMNEGEGQPGNPGPMPEVATFTGRVCGFKTPPGLELGAGQRLEARVYMSARYVYALPPFGSRAQPLVVLNDCGSFHIATRRYGALALYAEFGISDTSVSPATFTPLLMGIRRNVEAVPGVQVTGADIVLDMHLDVSVPVRVQPAAPPPGQVVMNQVYSYLDLGGEGALLLGQTQSLDDQFLFERHPRVSGEGIVFLNFAGTADLASGDMYPPYSFFYRRQYGDLTGGVDIGPMLAFTRVTTPASGGAFNGTMSWSFSGGQRPDVQQLWVDQPAGLSMKPIWEVVLPGAEQTVSLPTEALGALEPGAFMYWTLMTARAPRFDYDRFGFQQLGINSWTSFTQDYGYFVLP